MTLPLIRAQLRRTGVALAVPLTAGAVGAASGRWAAAAWSPSQAVLLVMGLEQVLVLCSGAALAAALTGDPLVELHESTPTTFRLVQVVRAALVTTSGAVGALVMFAPLHLAGIWPHDEGWVTLVVPVGAVLVLASVALAAAAGGTASSTVITVISAWLLVLVWDSYVQPLPMRRGLPLVGAVALAVVAWRRLGDAGHSIGAAEVGAS